MLKRLLALALIPMFALIPLASRAADPYVINVILPLTGPASFIGSEEGQALAVVEETVNKSGGIRGRPIHFAIVDDQSNPQVTVQLTNQIMAKKVPFFLGSSFTATCNAQLPLVKDGPVMYCFSPGAHPAEGSFAYSSSVSTKDELTVIARYFRERGLRKVAVITSTDATGQDAERNIDAAFSAPENQLEQIVVREHFNPSDVSVSAQMAHIKASDAQVLIAWSTGPAGGTLLRGATEAGLNVPIATTDGNLTYAQMKQYAAFLPKEMLFPAKPCNTPDGATGNLVPPAIRQKIVAYLDAFKAKGIRPDNGQSLAWDPAFLMLDALKSLGFDATPAQIKQFIDSLNRWTGIDGQYNFRESPQRGLGAQAALVVRWEPSKDTWVAVSKLGGAPLSR